jgi:acetolactate synthase-1/2/3 large subunit/sulfoacetaldehyde acetyltransferase
VAELSAARTVIELLRAEQVRHVFGIVGSTFLDVLDVLYDDKSVEYINVRHEQGAAFMADGLARVSGLPGACLVTAGPGATNLVTGMAAAHVAHSPVIAIAGGPPSGHYGKDAFQDFDLVSLFKPVTKLSMRIDAAARIPELFRLAFRTAMTGRKGPVFIDIPRDVLNDQVVTADLGDPSAYRPLHAPPANADAIDAAVRVLRQARRPLMLVGGGVTWAGANDAAQRLSADYGLPTITAYGRNDAVPNDDALYVGPLGRAGAAEAAAACKRADVLLVVGSRLGNFTTFYDDRYIQPSTRIIQIDIEARDLGRTYPVAVAIQADAGLALEALHRALAQAGIEPTTEEWRREIDTLRGKRRARLDADRRLTSLPLKPQRVYAELRTALPPDTIVTLDAGAAPAYGYDRLQFSRPRTFLTPLDLGGLGFAFPEALGAKLARPEAPVLAIHGDGGFLMNVQELETAVRHQINAVTLVMNNNAWGSEKAYQKHFYDGRYVGADITNPRFDKLAELFGARGYYVEGADQIGDVVRAALGCGKPAVIEIPIDPDEFPVPATTARRRG